MYICKITNIYKYLFLSHLEKLLMFVLGARVCKRGTCGTGLCLLTSSPPYYKCKCFPPFAPPNCQTCKT